MSAKKRRLTGLLRRTDKGATHNGTATKRVTKSRARIPRHRRSTK